MKTLAAHSRSLKTARVVSIAGTGSYLPKRILTNADLATLVDTSDEWITSRTGIKERHIVAENQATSDMAAEAARCALEQARIDPLALEMIVVATITPDMFFPSTSCLVQKAIGAANAACFDLNAACSGFVFGLETARQYIASGTYSNALVIGAETLTSITDWEDRATCVLFGDGAGAVVLRGQTGGRGLIASSMASDGRLGHLLHMPGGGSRNPATARTVNERMHYLKMAGKEVFKYAVGAMLNAARDVLKKANVRPEDVACVIPHQANKRIIQAVGERLGVPVERYYVILERTGNMSAASIPVALDEAVRSGFIKHGDLVLLVAFGGGFTWGAVLLEWRDPQRLPETEAIPTRRRSARAPSVQKRLCSKNASNLW